LLLPTFYGSFTAFFQLFFSHFPAIIQSQHQPAEKTLETAVEAAKIKTVIGSMQERSYFSFVM
jgi:hypothetical protein